jgi:HK97 family phage major capsid protein
MPNGILDMPFIQNSATASYIGEGTGVNASQPTEGRLQLVRKTMQAVVAITKELLRESSYEVDAFILMHIARIIGVREDLAFMRGDGTAGTPRGITFWAAQSSNGGSSHSFNRTLNGSTVPDVNTITADALKAMNLVESSNVPMAKPGWIMSPRDFYGLVKLRNSTTQMPIWPELLAGTWYGVPLKRSTQLPKTLAGDASGTGTGNKAEVLFADFDSLLIAESKSLELQAFDGGAYVNSGGTMQSGITNREVVITGDLGHDFGSMYRGDDCVAITSIDWGG